MTGFEYKYTSLEEVFSSITLLTSFWVLELIILAILLVGVSFLVYTVFPICFAIYDYNSKQREKKRKKKFLTQIALQREIEEEIEKEIEMKEEAKIAAKA